MIRLSTISMYQGGVDAMLEQQKRVFESQLQISSGRRFATPSDDPTAAAQVIGLSEAISRTEQFQENILAARTRLELEDEVLNSAGNVLQRARELAVQGLNDTLSPADRQGLAQEVRQLMDELLQLGNAKDGNGDYLFSGSMTSTQPFSHNGSGVFSYAGDQGQRTLQVGSSRRIADSDSGLDVFMKVPDVSGSGYQDMFSTLYQLAADLDADNPSDASLGQLDNALENLLQTRARVGARMNALDREEEGNAGFLLRLQETRSEIEDVDIAEAATRLNQQLLSLQAAQQAFSRVSNLSLFNFL